MFGSLFQKHLKADQRFVADFFCTSRFVIFFSFAHVFVRGVCEVWALGRG